MKPILALIVVLPILLLGACEPITNAIIDEIFLDYPYIEEPLDVAWKQSSAFRYISEDGNYWKSPREFEHDGGGDCEDFAGWLVYHLGKNASCAVIRRPGDATTHAVVRYKGSYLYIEPQKFGKTYAPSMLIPIGSLPGLDIEFLSTEISYDAVMKLSTAFYTK
jgi:hypothetical protein